jgi:hypothetical protein
MGTLTSVIRFVRGYGVSKVLMGGTLALGATLGVQGDPTPRVPQVIEASANLAGRSVQVSLVIYRYASPADLQVLSQAFQTGQDQALAEGLSKMKPAGHCSISGTTSYDVTFIQMVTTPSGRQITFIAARPRTADGSVAQATAQPLDLAIGQFDLNDNDKTKNTGFLYPASKLVADAAGAYHFDLTGSPLALVNVLDSKQELAAEVALGPAK